MWQDWNFWFSLITAIIAVAAVVLTVHQIRISNKQQKQNMGLTLYPLRRDILCNFSKRKYDDIYWDSEILFSDKITEGILNAGFSYNRYKEYMLKIGQYEMRLQEDEPALFQQYQHLIALANLPDAADEEREALFALCDQYKPVVPDDKTGEVLDYRCLKTKAAEAKRKAEAQHLKVFLAMKDEIKESIL